MRKKVIILALGLILSLLNSDALGDTTYVGGIIDTTAIWTPEGNPYVVYGSILVDTSGVLIIRPGVVVKFMRYYNLEVDGVLDARGTVNDSIIFTAYDTTWLEPGCWGGYIRFRDLCIDSSCIMEYCRIEYGSTNIICDHSSPTIRHCTIRWVNIYSTGCGAALSVSYGSPIIEYNTVAENSENGIVVSHGSPVIRGNNIIRNQGGSPVWENYPSGIVASASSCLISNNIISENTRDGIQLSGDASSIFNNTISKNGLVSGISITGGSVTVQNNVITENFACGAGIDLSYGFASISGNIIQRNKPCKWGYGGGGIQVHSYGSAIISGNIITENTAVGSPVTAGGIRVDAENVHINGNVIENNHDLSNFRYEISSGQGASPLDAEWNWWGTIDSATIENLIYDCHDNFQLRCVDFSPYSPCSTVSYIPLRSGWQWISTNIDLEPCKMESIFVDCWDDLDIAIACNGDFCIPGVGCWIDCWNVNEMYKLHMTDACTIQVCGYKVPTDTPIPLLAGWGCIAYFPECPLEPETALVSIWDNLDIVKNDGGEFCIPGVGCWIDCMEYNEGYKIHLSSADTLIYPTNCPPCPPPFAKRNSFPGFAKTAHFSYLGNTGESYSIVVNSVDLNGKQAEIGDEIGVFTSSGLCVGGGVWQGGILGIAAWQDDDRTEVVDGFKIGEQMIFKLWDKSENKEIELSASFEKGDERVGTDQYALVNLKGVSSQLPKEFKLAQNYPNPFNPETKIGFAVPVACRVQIKIYNVAGQLVKAYQRDYPAGVHSIIWDGTNTQGESVGSGIYFYRMEAGNFVQQKKMVLMK